MDAVTSEFLINTVSNTPFIAFLIWQNVNMRKDSKKQEDRFESLRLEAIEREEGQRTKFTAVIDGLNKDKDQLVESLEKRITLIEAQIRKLFSLCTKIQEQIKALRSKEKIT